MRNLFLKPVFALTIAISLFSCGIDGKNITGSGHVISQSRDLKDFTKVSASGGLDVTIEQADQFSVVVEADDNLQSHIKTTVVADELKITSDYNSFGDVKSKKVIVKMPKIKGIDAGGGVSLKSVGTLRSDDLTIQSSSGSDVSLTIESDKIVAQASSGSQLTLKGKALSLDTSSSSGSSIGAANLIANDVTAQASSGSSTEVHAALSIDAKASSGSSVEYRGAPKKVARHESSGGSVSGT
ncbi:MAG: DUF2807 domain-containing protein [Flavobacterium sp.]|nr:MAG: DUF2807 domain-containing protein [Flavobacterium sp.]